MWGMWNVIFLQNRAFWRLTFAIGMSHEFESQVNCQARLYSFSYSTPAVMTLQLPACFTRVAFWRVASCESLATSSRENPPMHTHLNFFTLSHTQLLHNSQLSTRYLNTKIQANLVQNKTNTWLNKFNLTFTIMIH